MSEAVKSGDGRPRSSLSQIDGARSDRGGENPAGLRVVVIADPDLTPTSSILAGPDAEVRIVRTAGSVQGARLGDAEGNRCVGVVMDISPHGVPRYSEIEAARALFPKARIVVCTAYPSLCLAVACMRLGAHDVLAKPINEAELIHVLIGEGRWIPLSMPSLSRVEWEYISKVLSHTGGNISAAAKLLGLQRSTLQRKLRKYPSAT